MAAVTLKQFPKNVPKWKKLNRHTLSAEYKDLDRDAYEALKASVEEKGWDRNNPIWLYQGLVVDGWQRMLVARDLDKMPPIKQLTLPAGWTARDWVESRNDARRHESADAALARSKAVRARVYKLIDEDKRSQRTVAEIMCLSRRRIQQFLDERKPQVDSPPCPPGTEEPGDVEIGTGKKDKKAAKLARPCATCKRRGPVHNCEHCAYVEKYGAFDLKDFKALLGPVKKKVLALAHERVAVDGPDHGDIESRLNDVAKEVQEWWERGAK